MKFPERENDILCIVATGYAWEKCVFGNTKKDYWTLNNMYAAGIKSLEFFNEWFQLHRPGSGEGHVDDGPMRSFLQEFPRPVWVQKDWGDEMPVRNPWIYPIDEVMERYCPRDAYGKPYPYFTNSVDYMICLAGLRGYSEVQLYGVEFISDIDDEYFTMRQSVNYYLARLTEAGVKVLVQPHSSLLKCPYWYAYESPKKDPLEKIMKENLVKLKGEHNKYLQQVAEANEKAKILEGGVQAMEQTLKIAGLRSKGAQI